ncbi:MAG: Acyl-(Acyl-carrier-protein)-UDP-N-acetylglucosamine O-acyltransferase [uncultured bacterium]|nr:MAG: Acyl-(Acyl-carrier-protein)-UDP-N-acetylglucosamine O-acyltransferase [uncultured bacterium]
MIHKTAIIDKKAKIEKDVEIGPHVIIGPNVIIHSGVVIQHHACVDNHTEIHNDVNIFPFASVGSDPQDLKFKKGDEAYCTVGKRTVIREFVTINAGSKKDHITQIGSDCLLMAYSHLGHNAVIGNHVIIANVGTLAGHVHIDDNAIVGGLVGIHQFVKVGKMVIVGGCSKVVKDIPPFMLADGNPAEVRGINKIGLRRHNYTTKQSAAIKDAYKILYRSKLTRPQALKKLQDLTEEIPEVGDILDFIAKSNRGITKG